MYGDEEEFKKEILVAENLEYQDFIGDFINDRPVYHSGVLKNVRVPVDKSAQMTKVQAQRALMDKTLKSQKMSDKVSKAKQDAKKQQKETDIVDEKKESTANDGNKDKTTKNWDESSDDRKSK